MSQAADQLQEIRCGDSGPSGLASRKRGQYLGWVALISLGAAFAATFFFCPRFVEWRSLKLGMEQPPRPYPEVIRAVDALEQIKHPFEPVHNPTVNRVITWRLLFPVTWHYLHLPHWLYLATPHLGCLLTLGLIAHLVLQRTGNRWWAFLAALLMATCNWFFVSMGWLAYFDSWAIGGLLLLAFGNSRVVLALVCLLSPWIDERFLLAVPLCLVIRTVDGRQGEGRGSRDLLWDCVAALVPCLLYPLLRVVLACGGIGGNETSDYVRNYFTWTRITSISPIRYLEGTWHALRSGWFVVFVPVWFLWTTHRRVLGGTLALVLTGTLAVCMLVADDLSRTICLISPLLLLGVLEIVRQQPHLARIALPTLVAANLVLPAYSIITCMQPWPIFYFHAEMDHWRHPPPYLVPEAYMQRGIQFAIQRNFSQAEHCFAVALKLDGDFAPALLNRAVMRFNQGDLDSARQDAEHAVRVNGNDPEAYFVRAMVRLRVADASGAVADLEKALQIAPPEWPRRREAQDMLIKAKSQSLGGFSGALP
jgi:hypothetical protein